jgi:hypothetical protein
MRINGREKQFRDISGDISSPAPKKSLFKYKCHKLPKNN